MEKESHLKKSVYKEYVNLCEHEKWQIIPNWKDFSKVILRCVYCGFTKEVDRCTIEDRL